MMATDPFDPNIDRALGRRAASRAEPARADPVVAVPTLFGPIGLTPERPQTCSFGECRHEATGRR